MSRREKVDAEVKELANREFEAIRLGVEERMLAMEMARARGEDVDPWHFDPSKYSLSAPLPQVQSVEPAYGANLAPEDAGRPRSAMPVQSMQWHWKHERRPDDLTRPTRSADVRRKPPMPTAETAAAPAELERAPEQLPDGGFSAQPEAELQAPPAIADRPIMSEDAYGGEVDWQSSKSAPPPTYYEDTAESAVDGGYGQDTYEPEPVAAPPVPAAPPLPPAAADEEYSEPLPASKAAPPAAAGSSMATLDPEVRARRAGKIRKNKEN